MNIQPNNQPNSNDASINPSVPPSIQQMFPIGKVPSDVKKHIVSFLSDEEK